MTRTTWSCSRTRLLRLAGRQDEVGTIQVGKRADLVLIALDEVTTGLCGPDGAAVVYYGVPQPSTWR